MTWNGKHRLMLFMAIPALLAAVVAAVVFHEAPEKPHPLSNAPYLVPVETLGQTYRFSQEGESKRFENFVDGYALRLPKEMHVSFDRFQLRTRLTFPDGAVMDVFKTEIAHNGLSSMYLTVSSGQHESAPICFMNAHDHKVIARDNDNRAGVSSTAMRWERRPLKKVVDDKPYYYAADLAVKPYTAVTFLYKGNHPIDFDRLEAIEEIVNSYEDGQATVKAFIDKDESSGRTPASWNKKTADFYKTFFRPSAPLRWGIFEPSYAAKDYDTLKGLEKKLGTRFHVLVHYMDFERSDPIKDVLPILKEAAKEGRAVELTLQTNNPYEGPSDVYDVLNGKMDAYLDELAQVIVKSEAVVLMRVGNEMNGDWCVYSPVHLSRDPDVYVAFYRYVIDRLEAGGAGKQMIYVWNPNGEDFPPYRWNNPHLTYPGNLYCDVIGLTAYNTGNYYGWEPWLDFQSLYRATYDQATGLYNRPLMITEFACSSIGGDKSAWVRDMLSRIDREFPEIKVAIWWNHADYDPKKPEVMSRPYFIDQPKATEDAFREYFRNHNRR